MKNIYTKILFVLACNLLLWACNSSKEVSPEMQFIQPKNFPAPHYNLSKNPITTAGFELGQALFYDGILSRDGSISCGSCHQQTSAFTQHGHDLSHGIDDKLTKRNALPIQNLAWEKEFFWDGGVFDLDLFAISPIEAHNEMDETLPNVLDKLRKSSKYPQLFEKAFGSKEITTANFLKALSQFQLMCISSNSRYDKYIRKEGENLTNIELQGLDIFKQKCATCHAGELFTDLSFRNNGLQIGNPEDKGRALITLNENDNFKFRVPSLRNVAISAPYMHDGRFRNLEGVIEHYQNGIKDSQTLDEKLKQNGKLGIAISEDEKMKLIAFLKTLTDESFLTDKRLSEF